MSTPIFEHRKRGGSRLIAQFSEFRGSEFIDLREWVDADGELRPTKRGCTIPTDIAPLLGEALARLNSQRV